MHEFRQSLGSQIEILPKITMQASVFHLVYGRLKMECQGKHPEFLAGKWAILSVRNVTIIFLNDLRKIYPLHK